MGRNLVDLQIYVHQNMLLKLRPGHHYTNSDDFLVPFNLGLFYYLGDFINSIALKYMCQNKFQQAESRPSLRFIIPQEPKKKTML